MTIKTVHLAPTITDQNGTRPAAYILRRGFEIDNVDGTPRPDRRTGEPVYTAEVLVPGLINSRFQIDNDRPETIKLKVVGGQNPGHPAGSIIRLDGRCTLTAWYQARARGNAARSDLTITAERVHLAPGEQPLNRGGIPATFPDVGAMFVGQHRYIDATDPGSCDLMFEPSDVYVVDGVAEITCTSKVPDDLIGADVRPLGLRAYFIAPDAQDVSQRAKAEIVLVCTAFERRSTANGHKPTPPKTEPAKAEA